MHKLTVYLDIDGTILYDPGDDTRRGNRDYQQERNHRRESFVQMEPSNPHNPARILAEIKSRLENN